MFQVVKQTHSSYKRNYTVDVIVTCPKCNIINLHKIYSSPFVFRCSKNCNQYFFVVISEPTNEITLQPFNNEFIDSFLIEG